MEISFTWTWARLSAAVSGNEPALLTSLPGGTQTVPERTAEIEPNLNPAKQK